MVAEAESADGPQGGGAAVQDARVSEAGLPVPAVLPQQQHVGQLEARRSVSILESFLSAGSVGMSVRSDVKAVFTLCVRSRSRALAACLCLLTPARHPSPPPPLLLRLRLLLLRSPASPSSSPGSLRGLQSPVDFPSELSLPLSRSSRSEVKPSGCALPVDFILSVLLAAPCCSSLTGASGTALHITLSSGGVLRRAPAPRRIGIPQLMNDGCFLGRQRAAEKGGQRVRVQESERGGGLLTLLEQREPVNPLLQAQTFGRSSDCRNSRIWQSMPCHPRVQWQRQVFGAAHSMFLPHVCLQTAAKEVLGASVSSVSHRTPPTVEPLLSGLALDPRKTGPVCTGGHMFARRRPHPQLRGAVPRPPRCSEGESRDYLRRLKARLSLVSVSRELQLRQGVGQRGEGRGEGGGVSRWAPGFGLGGGHVVELGELGVCYLFGLRGEGRSGRYYLRRHGCMTASLLPVPPPLPAAGSCIELSLLPLVTDQDRYTSVPVESGGAAPADVSDVRRPAVDALNAGETRPARTAEHLELCGQSYEEQMLASWGLFSSGFDSKGSTLSAPISHLVSIVKKTAFLRDAQLQTLLSNHVPAVHGSDRQSSSCCSQRSPCVPSGHTHREAALGVALVGQREADRTLRWTLLFLLLSSESDGTLQMRRPAGDRTPPPGPSSSWKRSAEPSGSDAANWKTKFSPENVNLEVSGSQRRQGLLGLETPAAKHIPSMLHVPQRPCVCPKSTLGARTDRLIPQSPTSALTKAPEGKINYERRGTSSSSLTSAHAAKRRGALDPGKTLIRLGRFPSRVKSVTAVIKTVARPQLPPLQASGRSSTWQADSATFGDSCPSPSADVNTAVRTPHWWPWSGPKQGMGTVLCTVTSCSLLFSTMCSDSGENWRERNYLRFTFGAVSHAPLRGLQAVHHELPTVAHGDGDAEEAAVLGAALEELPGGAGGELPELAGARQGCVLQRQPHWSLSAAEVGISAGLLLIQKRYQPGDREWSQIRSWMAVSWISVESKSTLR
ncbi:hypothetical protein F7725_009138 [Dissostichus mawsoni]|uniref:Uncharacterized protein n=1 Tax=Dissostichus mawsoni TaxID=36200 RepID=A0A7J5Z856_DISMA|nr:hypothetical protein F7725_009138 [Dissostichus mawsoni]